MPQPTSNLYKDSDLSNKTALTVRWDKVEDASMPVIGYILQIAEFGSSQFSTIFNGTNRPATRQFTQAGLVTGAKYTFRVITLNFNGLSQPSSLTTFNVCLAPSGMP